MGRFKPGDQKPQGSGRKPGTPNKKTTDLFEKCDAQGIDPFEALLEIAKEDDPGLRLSALKEICSYLYPKRKSIEKTDAVKEDDDHDDISTEDLLLLVKELKDMK